MAENKYKHLQRSYLSSGDITQYQRVNKAYQDVLGTQNDMQSPYTLDVDEQKVAVRRSAYPSFDTVKYFNGSRYNQKKNNMKLSAEVSATMRENQMPALRPGELVDPELYTMSQYSYNTQDDTSILLYLGAFVIGVVIFTSLV